VRQNGAIEKRREKQQRQEEEEAEVDGQMDDISNL